MAVGDLGDDWEDAETSALSNEDGEKFNRAFGQYLDLDVNILEEANKQVSQALQAQIETLNRLEQRTIQTIMFASALIAFAGTLMLQAVDSNPIDLTLLFSAMVATSASFLGIVGLFYSTRPLRFLGQPGSSPSVIDLSVYNSGDAKSDYSAYLATTLAMSELQYEKNHSNHLTRSWWVFLATALVISAPGAGVISYAFEWDQAFSIGELLEIGDSDTNPMHSYNCNWHFDEESKTQNWSCTTDEPIQLVEGEGT